MKKAETGGWWFDIMIDRYIQTTFGKFDESKIKEFRYGRDTDELIVEFKDGSKDIYDVIFDSRRTYKTEDDIPDFDDEEIYRKWFARNLDRCLYKKQFPNWKIARETGISEQTISYYINGVRLPNARNIYKLARVLDVSYDELMDPWKVFEL